VAAGDGWLVPQPAARTPTAINGASMRNTAEAFRIDFLRRALVPADIMGHGGKKIQHLD
jgi:hypothetical protein